MHDDFLIRKKNQGQILETASGKRAVYHYEPFINGKAPVHVVDENFQKTGEKMLVTPAKCKLIGFID